MSDRRMPSVFTIPPTRPFADALVSTLLDEREGDGLALARGIILVPNSRAGIAIRDAFVRRSGDGLLLPRIVAIGDAELDETIGAAFDPIADEPLPPEVDPLVRQMVLARMIQKAGGGDAAEVMRQAADLGRTLDQLTVEEKPASCLADLDMGDLQHHWKASLDVLKAIMELWPDALAAMCRIDRAERRNRLLNRAARHWAANPPGHRVVAAGISTAAPAIARLLATVARLPGGAVVLAGLDRAMPRSDWDALPGEEGKPPVETHPQFHLRLLLDRIGVSRDEVEDWPQPDRRPARQRDEPVWRAFALPETTRQWVDLPAASAKLPTVRAMIAQTPAEEAQAIALAMRQQLETPERTVALVTPDRDLANRVSAMLLRWGIVADDSAGKSLARTPAGSLILALATAMASGFAPAALMAVLKHPLVFAGEARQTWLDGVRLFDRALRGPRPGPGLGGIDRFLAGGEERDRPLREEAARWWEGAARVILSACEMVDPTFESSLAVIRTVSSALAGDGLWSGPEGRALAELFDRLEANAVSGPELRDPASLPPLLRPLLDGVIVRPAYGGHPRVFIWGLLEARLQSADLLILGGLNEGSWPQLPAPDPWLAPRVRRELGMPGLDRRIGLAAHDLAMALGAPAVILSRAERDARSPTIASRFWRRIEAMTGGLKPPDCDFVSLARQLEAHSGRPERAARPQQKPPAAERPRTINVTDVDRLTADPYSFYARTMLRLVPLDPLDAEPGPAWRGTMIHRVLEDWGEADGYAGGALVSRMEAALSDGTLHPLVRSLWLPRLVEAAQWIEDRVAANRADGRVPIKSEIAGETAYRGITIRGRADRIDRLADGTLAVIDYKTGAPPSGKQIAAGYAMQLGLIGLIAEAGGFSDVNGTPRGFEYWSLSRDGKAGSFGKTSSPVTGRNAVSRPEEFVSFIAGQFADAAARWLTGDAPFIAKLQPEYAWSDYDQLMRLEEWEGRHD